MRDNEEQVADKAAKETAREDALREHNARSGGADVVADEREAQRVAHNARTGGYVPE